MFNALLTSLPVIALEVFKQDVASDVCLQVKKIGTQMQPATQAYTNFRNVMHEHKITV